MQNYELLKKIGRKAPQVPVLLKRGMSATKKELTGAIGYLLSEGHNNQIMICERGVKSSFTDSYSRNILDLNLVADLHETQEFPVIVDPSHASGRRDLIGRLSCAGILAGADGLMIECHPCPEKALCDSAQQIRPEALEKIAATVYRLHQTFGPGENEPWLCLNQPGLCPA
jgi:3-deoxy-7-phosphoheptulonate synthase